jgi:hypothetical protein
VDYASWVGANFIRRQNALLFAWDASHSRSLWLFRCWNKIWQSNQIKLNQIKWNEIKLHLLTFFALEARVALISFVAHTVACHCWHGNYAPFLNTLRLFLHYSPPSL